MIEEIRTTAVQYSGYFEDTIRKFLKRTEVVPESEETRVQRVLDEERKRIQKIVETRARLIEHYEPYIKRRKQIKEEGKYIDILI